MAIESQELTVKEVVNEFTGKQVINGNRTTTVSMDGAALITPSGADAKVEFEDGSYMIVDESVATIGTALGVALTNHLDISIEEIRYPNNGGNAEFSTAITSILVIESYPEVIITSEGSKGRIILPNGMEIITTENFATLSAAVAVDHIDVTVDEMQSEVIGKRALGGLSVTVVTQGASGLEVFSDVPSGTDAVILLKKSGIRLLVQETYAAVTGAL